MKLYGIVWDSLGQSIGISILRTGRCFGTFGTRFKGVFRVSKYILLDTASEVIQMHQMQRKNHGLGHAAFGAILNDFAGVLNKTNATTGVAFGRETVINPCLILIFQPA